MKPMHPRNIILGLALVLCFVTAAFADQKAAPKGHDAAVTSLAPWAGEFQSTRPLWNNAKADALLNKIAQACQRKKMDMDAAAVGNIMKGMYFTDFTKMDIKDTSVTYTPMGDVLAPVTVEYDFRGELVMNVMGHKVQWYAFQARKVDGATQKYKYLLLTKQHAHAGKQPHFHMRYGSSNFADIMQNKSLAKWWPTMVGMDFNFDKFAEGIDPNVFARFLKS